MNQPAQATGTGAAPARPRVGVKALVIRGGLLLCVRKRDESGDICSFPGGGQEPGETLVEAVRREFREEVGLDVEVGELLFVREYRDCQLTVSPAARYGPAAERYCCPKRAVAQDAIDRGPVTQATPAVSVSLMSVAIR